MSPITVLGMVAGVMTTVSFLPQLFKVWQSKSASDLSFVMLLILNVGMLLWLIYGILIHDIAVILTHSISLILASLILGLKLRFQLVQQRRVRRLQALERATSMQSSAQPSGSEYNQPEYSQPECNQPEYSQPADCSHSQPMLHHPG